MRNCESGVWTSLRFLQLFLPLQRDMHDNILVGVIFAYYIILALHSSVTDVLPGFSRDASKRPLRPGVQQSPVVARFSSRFRFRLA